LFNELAKIKFTEASLLYSLQNEFEARPTKGKHYYKKIRN